MDRFFKYGSESERVMFESCSDLEGVDQEEWLEIMDTHNCLRLPTADNIDQILRELAHQKLIESPLLRLNSGATCSDLLDQS